MKKIKKIFSGKKNLSKSETSLQRSVIGERGSLQSLGNKKSGEYDVKSKELNKIHKAVLEGDVAKVEKLALKEVNSRDAQDRYKISL